MSFAHLICERIDLTYEGIATPDRTEPIWVRVHFERIDLTYEGIATFPRQFKSVIPALTERIDLTYEGIATLLAFLLSFA